MTGEHVHHGIVNGHRGPRGAVSFPCLAPDRFHDRPTGAAFARLSAHDAGNDLAVLDLLVVIEVAFADEKAVQIAERTVLLEETAMYEEDLVNSTEIMLGDRRRVRPSTTAPRTAAGSGGRAARAAAGALRIGNTVGAAFGSRRMLGPAESGMMFSVALVFLLLAAIAVAVPLAITVPIVALALWIAVTLLVRAWRTRRSGVEDDPGTED